MGYQPVEIKKFLGLFAQANSFDLPDGAAEKAKNVLVNNDNTIDKLNGFYQYFGLGSGTLVNLHLYQGKLLGTFTNKISYFTDSGTAPNLVGVATDLTGQSFTLTPPRVSRSAEQSGNFYWTTDSGVMKIDAYNGKIFDAGAPPGLDIRGNLRQLNGPFQGNSQIGYRALFGRRDGNDNLLLGAPSDVLVLTNILTTDVIWTRTSNVVTVVSPNNNLAAGMTIQIVGTSTGTLPPPNGTYTVTAASSSSFTFAQTAGDNTTGGNTLSYQESRTPLIEWSIPNDITTTADEYFFRIYRTTQSNSSDSTPSPDFRLVEERVITSAEIAAGFVTYQDDTDDILLTNAPELYTNPNSQEGELQANARPPLVADLALFKNYLFYANAITRDILNVNVVDAGALANNDYVEVKIGALTRRYVLKTGVGNKTVPADSVSNSGGKIQVNYVAHGFSNGWYIYVSTITGGTLAAGYYFVVSAAADTFQISLTSGGAAINYAGETGLYFEGVDDGTYAVAQLSNTSPSVAVQLRDTAQGLVKAINRDNQSLTYANYVSGISDTPGKMRLSAKGFTEAIYMRANTTTAGGAFAPVLPSSFASGTQVFSTDATQPNRVYFSKVGEPEAVPIVNNLPIGSKNKAIKRIFALRDSIIVLKEDGVFKITGDNPSNFTATILDNTIVVAAENSAALLNNQVHFLANQGICTATDSAVQIISRRIERLIEPIIGVPELADQTYAVGYESNRTYRVCTLLPGGTAAAEVYMHNTINDTWTTSDTLFKGAAIGPLNVLYLISTDGRILKERKNNNRIDYCGQNWDTTVISASGNTAVLTVPGYTPRVGDVVLKNSVFSRIRSVTAVGSDFRVTFARATNLVAADTPVLYERIVSEVTMAPFHGGMVGRNKVFAQLQLHTRDQAITRIRISFSGPFFGGSPDTEWLDTKVTGSSGGWGFEPWGYFPWGLADGINTPIQTQVAPIVRLWVPQLQQRGTFIQIVIVHEEAGEQMEIQAMTWSIRAYGERVSK